MKKLTKFIGACLIMMFLVLPASAAEVVYHWTAPTTGSSVVYYVVEVEIDGGEWEALVHNPTENTVVIDQTPNKVYRVRVHGVDINEHHGVVSIASTPYDFTAPGACGMPWRSE